MNDYEEKQEKRRERLEAAADKAAANAAAAGNRAEQMAHMMNGQPVLVGHHSEKRHRRDIGRMDRLMGKAVTESDRAKDLQRRAAAVGSGGISADDPEAVQKLVEKLDNLEKTRERRKALNRYWRKHHTFEGFEGVSAETALKLAAQMEMHRFRQPWPSWSLTNLGARIRATKARIEQLRAEANAQHVEHDPVTFEAEGKSYTAQVIEDPDDNRVLVEFSARPPRYVTQTMRRYGFRWSPTRGAWCRQLNDAATTWALRLIQEGWALRKQG